MRKHLEGELDKIGENAEEEEKETAENKNIITNEQIMEDNQLKSGIDILKSLMIMNK
jgi:carboxyl-terminal processing protease